MTNQRALDELLSLWRQFQRDPNTPMPGGKTKWRDLFIQLREIRTWDVQDRLRNTGILEDWRERVVEGDELIQFETELWFRDNSQVRDRSQTIFESIIYQNQGRIIAQSIITAIGYHGLLAELPIIAVDRLLNSTETQFFKCDQVMFFRPVGQSVMPFPVEEEVLLDDKEISSKELSTGEPIIGLLDGLPIENHSFLRERIIIDDPENWGNNYPANERHHGTAMVSLIVHGELDANQPPLNSPIYVRPILKPDPLNWNRPRGERIPIDKLAIDLIHSAVRRMYEGEGNESASAPNVKIINFSVGDPSRQFDSFLSPMARLLDWLSWRYGVLFIVSAGNHKKEITYNMPEERFLMLNSEQLQEETIKAISNDLINRKILSPAEAINVVTVGAANDDRSTFINHHLINPVSAASLNSPINGLGLGYRRSIKPDILLPGGRLLYNRMYVNATTTRLTPVISNRPPGQRTASPGVQPGVLNATCYTQGTSNAAALATHQSGLLFELIENLRNEEGGELLEEQYTSLLIKSLLIHSATWGDEANILKNALSTFSRNHIQEKENVNRFIGYGNSEFERVDSCSDQRVTLLGCGNMGKDETHEFRMPLPPSLSGQRIWRRLTITLTWFTPINPKHRAYRKAHLFFDTSDKILQIKRSDSYFHTVKRGTVQHEVFEGTKAAAFVDGDDLLIKVNCKEDAGSLDETIPYTLAVTLEVAEEIDIPIYEEIRTRIRTRVQIQSENRL